MHSTTIPVALALLLGGAVLAQAQSVRDIPAPRETPPISFKGAQYVDSQGCVFVRAGVDGRVIWVPRVNASRQVLCGYPPTLVAGTAPGVVRDAPAIGTAAPKRRNAATVIEIAPTTVAPQRVDLLQPVVPAGYKLAWKDGRLNPNRARGTAAGQMAQDQVWTRETPARLVKSAAPAGLRVSTRDAAPVLRVSTKAARDAFVQVGSFGQPANARAVRTQLLALGLPVATADVVRGGRKIVVVTAGPFADAGTAQSALVTIRQAGLSDAFIR